MTLAHYSPEAWQYVFNTPLECGLRCAALLLSSFPASHDLQRLVQYEYLLVHSGDIPDGPPSLHPAVPHRAGELLVRRGLVERGLLFMVSHRIVCRRFSGHGIEYLAAEMALPFFDSLSAPYTAQLRDRAEWVTRRFDVFGDPELSNFMRGNWSNWGAEFVRESFARGGEA